MHILGIESSCDDTSVALIDITDKKLKVLAEKTASQIEIHKKYGGVVPEIAGRMHAENIVPVIEAVLDGYERPDLIAVTYGPGLITGLMVGVEAGKTLSYAWDIPLIGVNHIEGHIYSVELSLSHTTRSPIAYPALALIVSGGHTELAYTKKSGVYTKIGGTRDDAVGECFDKIAKLLGMPYPGGPLISKYAQKSTQPVIFPRPMITTDTYDMSFAGLKTAVFYWLKKYPLSLENTAFQDGEHTYTLADVCAGVEQVITDVLIARVSRALTEYRPQTLILAGGVSANTTIRQAMQHISTEHGCICRIPELPYTTDNAAMIAVAGYHRYRNNEVSDWKSIIADPQSTIYT